MGQVRNSSITFDEGPHLAVGYATLRTGDFRLQPVHIHPPLANVLAAAPLILLPDLPDPTSVSGWEIASLSAITDEIVWKHPYPRRLATLGRFPIVAMSLVLVAVVWRWASGVFGRRAGLLALVLCAFDPNLVAHGSLVTTDLPVVLWGILLMFLTARYMGTGHRLYIAGAGLVLGLALVTKVSALLLVVPCALLWLVGPPRTARAGRLAWTTVAFILAGLVVWATYGFELRVVSSMTAPLPAATHVEIYQALQEHYRLGHPSFIAGRNSSRGWWYYFPLAFMLKTPLPALALTTVSAGLLAGRLLRGGRQSPQLASMVRRWGPLLFFPALHAVSSLFSSVNIGYRHLLPILPFLYIVISWLAMWSKPAPGDGGQMTRVSARAAIGVMILWQVVGTLRVFPTPLTFFNELAGGPGGGYRYLVDSNLDWGQDLWRLRGWMERGEVGRVFYGHFSPARPNVYGISADLLPPDPRAVSIAPFDPDPGVYAIGATVLQGAYTPDINTYAWFRSREPNARLGRALFVYRVGPVMPPSWSSVCGDLLTALPSERLRQDYGNPDLRIISVNCSESWVFAAGSDVGVHVLAPGSVPPPGSRLEVVGRSPDGSTLFEIYRTDRSPSPPHALGATVEGPLELLGFHAGRGLIHSGDAIELWTYWRVADVPSRPISLLAHLVDERGSLIRAGDGLGVELNQLRVGDLVVQRHRLTVPDDAPPGSYALYVGAYWLDTMERWPVTGGEPGTDDRICVGELEIRS
jgi:hypothetical protein